MKKVIWAVSLAAALSIAAPVAVNAQSNVGGIRSDIINEEAVRSLYAEFSAAWNRHDPDGLVALYTIDGDHVEPDGRRVSGQQDLVALFKKQHDSIFGKTTLSLSIDDVWFLGTDVALVDGTYAISGIYDPKGNEIAPRKGYLTALLLSEHGTWRIAASRLMIPASLPYRLD